MKHAKTSVVSNSLCNRVKGKINKDGGSYKLAVII